VNLRLSTDTLRPILDTNPERDFWNFTHAARIRPFLEQAVRKSVWFSSRFAEGRVTEEVIFGTVNRVSRRCSNNPKMRSRGFAQVTCPS
jgi:hypothetical protein